jgi:hypothetical protein
MHNGGRSLIASGLVVTIVTAAAASDAAKDWLADAAADDGMAAVAVDLARAWAGSGVRIEHAADFLRVHVDGRGRPLFVVDGSIVKVHPNLAGAARDSALDVLVALGDERRAAGPAVADHVARAAAARATRAAAAAHARAGGAAGAGAAVQAAAAAPR